MLVRLFEPSQQVINSGPLTIRVLLNQQSIGESGRLHPLGNQEVECSRNEHQISSRCFELDAGAHKVERGACVLRDILFTLLKQNESLGLPQIV
jgi:hypothetical protein